MSIGTKEGTEEEISFVKLMNSDKKHRFWKVLGIDYDTEDLFAVHVKKEKYGKINEAKVKTKADVIICRGRIGREVLKEKDFYLDESDITRYNLKELDKTGISVKRRDSYRYQILKMNPTTFKKIFGNTELGAGASIYCTRAGELEKNNSVLKGWKTDWAGFEKYFSFIKNVCLLKDKTAQPETRLSIAKEIKAYSNGKIHRHIDENKQISDFVFMGMGNFDEPFTATWLFEKGDMKKAGPIDFVVTTGSGRSHGDFTVVIKPKN